MERPPRSPSSPGPRWRRQPQPPVSPRTNSTLSSRRNRAGASPLEIRHDNAWFQARIRPIDWATAEAVFRTRIGPQLDRLGDNRASWWFLRKHPSWRIRIRTTDHGAAGALLDDLAAAGVIAGWEAGIYEPETAAFGGLSATAIVHELFCGDSRGVLAYALPSWTGSRGCGGRRTAVRRRRR
ncbi:thiopeptide-type bacteriocin biosynthesis protein [Micromonospora matsumotoense]|uniref:thiopeptide-type bacteriocin biosynthesis protein n=1 Tax=Micromonospora matsumotoense TaxID=121616 RepID=UPI000B814E37|nr:thiopeptide-type bacteriocin biosynthesis protein [Micromonospora matsumotoense]